MPRADLTIKTDVFRSTTLRADRIRRDTLVQLAAAYRDDPTRVINVLDDLAEVVRCPADAEGAEIDAAVDDVEIVCDMGPASMEVARPDLMQLINEALTAYRQQPSPVRPALSSKYVRGAA
jgi:hypothetical protein